MRNYKEEEENRVNWIISVLNNSNAKGIVFGNSGGKDSALVGILCKKATKNTLSIIMPCASSQNYSSDKEHAELLSRKFDIETRIVDLSESRKSLISAICGVTENDKLTSESINNINPRLRMTTLYAIGQTNGYLVAGTGNKSELYMGYFTKYGDGGVDFNPIADLTATEIFEFLQYLNAPSEIINKAPSAGLYDGQTDEKEMGITYKSIDNYLQTNEVSEIDFEIIDKAHKLTQHKRNLPLFYNPSL
jgi:NAD+ synthase